LRLLFFDFGSGEILLIVLAAFIIFGPSKIPEIARNLGKFINDIKRASEDIKTEINKEADRIERDKKLKDYKSKIEKDLKPEDAAKTLSEEDPYDIKEVKPEKNSDEDSAPQIQ
jgi:Tat protein translocase TatB subunit